MIESWQLILRCSAIYVGQGIEKLFPLQGLLQRLSQFFRRQRLCRTCGVVDRRRGEPADQSRTDSVGPRQRAGPADGQRLRPAGRGLSAAPGQSSAAGRLRGLGNGGRLQQLRRQQLSFGVRALGNLTAAIDLAAVRR